MIDEGLLSKLIINGKTLTDYTRTLYPPVTVGDVRYIILVVHLSEGSVVIKTTNNAVFGLLIYGQREHDGHGFAGNVVLPDVCVP